MLIIGSVGINAQTTRNVKITTNFSVEIGTTINFESPTADLVIGLGFVHEIKCTSAPTGVLLSSFSKAKVITADLFNN